MSFVSQFQNVIRTNFVPSQSQIDEIDQILRDPTAKLRELDDEIRLLQEELDTVTREKESLLMSIDGHRRLLTPFRGLPDDVLGEIFMWCLPTTYEAIADRNEPPLVLGYVCRRWRTVAYNMSRLWATLHIPIPKVPRFRGRVYKKKKKDLNITFERNMRDHLGGIWAWLCRSKACPLSISIHDPNSSTASWDCETPTTKYYEVVCGFAARIYRLQLDVKQDMASDYLAGLPSCSFPILRVLFLKFDRRLPYPEWGNTGLLNAPNLSCLRISWFPLCLHEVHANWSNLTFIIATGSFERELDILDALKIFSSCPQLYYCGINISGSIPVLWHIYCSKSL